MMVLLVLAMFMGCAHRQAMPLAQDEPPLDLVLVPGCPTDPSGTISPCQWFRAMWATMLYENGVSSYFVTAGGAAYTPHLEAISIKAAMVVLGVPEEIIYTETQSLHTDENVAFSLVMMDELSLSSFGIASQGFHARMGCRLARSWGRQCVVLVAPEKQVHTALGQRFRRRWKKILIPEVLNWIPIEQQELARDGHARPASWWLYATRVLVGPFDKDVLPQPPQPEPTLQADP